MANEINLQRFLDAQQNHYATTHSEIASGKKISHWMWYIFPQIKGLGTSETARYFAIQNLEEAVAYYQHPILGKRLLQITQTLLSVNNKSAFQIFGHPDDVKLKSSMTLFSQIKGADNLFLKVLHKYYKGEPDLQTLTLLK